MIRFLADATLPIFIHRWLGVALSGVEACVNQTFDLRGVGGSAP